jgi:amino acid transporter
LGLRNLTRTFVRESTGLVKNVSLLHAVSINVSDMAAGALLAVVGFTTVLLPSMSGVNLVYASLIGFLLIVPQIVIYTMMTRRMPRTGGDYVWVSRVFGGFAGNVLAFLGYTVGNLPFLALIALSATFAIGSVGVSLGYSGLLGLALPGNIPGSNTLSQFIVTAVILILLFGINIYRPKYAYRLISAFTIIGIIALILAIGVLLANGRTGVINYMSSLGNANLTYASVASSYSGPGFGLGATLFVLPLFAYFVYPWFNAGPAVASEIRGKNAIRWNVPISALVSLVLVTVAFGAMYYAGGLEFTNAALSNPSLVYNYSFNFWTLAMGVANNPILAWIIGIGWILWVVNIITYLILVEARYLLAQSFDRFLPSRIAYVSKYGSPVVAHLVDFIIAIGLVAGATFLYGTFIAMYGTFVGPTTYFLFVGLAAAVYALRKEKGSTKAILVTFGILSALAFLYVEYLLVASPAVWGGNSLAYGFIVSTAIGAAIIYYVSKAYQKKRGVDISLVYKELPPE